MLCPFNGVLLSKLLLKGFPLSANIFNLIYPGKGGMFTLTCFFSGLLNHISWSFSSVIMSLKFLEQTTADNRLMRLMAH